jgi:hypothetical protein
VKYTFNINTSLKSCAQYHSWQSVASKYAKGSLNAAMGIALLNCKLHQVSTYRWVLSQGFAYSRHRAAAQFTDAWHKPACELFRGLQDE